MTIELRIARMERQIRRWQWMTMILLFSIAFFVYRTFSSNDKEPLLSQPVLSQRGTTDKITSEKVYDSLQAKSLTVSNIYFVDDNGKGGGHIVASDSGAMLYLTGKNGEGTVSVGSIFGPAGFFVQGPTGYISIDSDGLRLYRMTLEKKLQRDVAAKAISEKKPIDKEQVKSAYEDIHVLSLGQGEGGGGMIDVYSPLDKKVVSIQATKRNEGGVYVFNVDGSYSNALTGGK
jgi:hypothetical protein